MNRETVTIPKDEYIELLRCKADIAEARATSAATPHFVKYGLTQKWMSQEEKAEIARLHALGYRIVEIQKMVGRSYSTVRNRVKRLRTA